MVSGPGRQTQKRRKEQVAEQMERWRTAEDRQTIEDLMENDCIDVVMLVVDEVALGFGRILVSTKIDVPILLAHLV